VGSHTNGHEGASVAMQPDGNLVVYDDDPGHTALWSSGTHTAASSALEVQDDGNVVIYAPGRQAVWATNTGSGSSRPVGNDYRYANSVSCPNCQADRWGFYARERTSFVARRMNRDGGEGSFTNWMRGGRWGNAREWNEYAAALRIRVDTTPTVGSIAHWDGNEGGMASDG
jgi:surface antigen